jgi:hypothetical protein
MTTQKVILECKTEMKSPVITKYTISQDQHQRIREIAEENSSKTTSKKDYPFVYNPGGKGE